MTHRHAARGEPHHAGARAAGARALRVVLGLTAAYMAVEVAVGIAAGSLALVADAAHMLADTFGLGMALVAIRFAQRPATPERTYGFYRAEILAALVNAVLLTLLAGWLLVEAWYRIRTPREVGGVLVTVAAAGGLVVNVVAARVLHRHADESLNMHGALQEVLADLVGSVAALASGAVIVLTGWTPIDPIVSALIALFILPRAFRLLASAVDVLLEAAPRHIDLARLETAMRAVPGVTDVHDLHVWTITSGFVAMSGHVTAGGRPSVDVLHDLQEMLRERFSVEHVTLQVEAPGHADDGACCRLDPRCLMLWPPTRPPRR
jgi:cobalt-zinc-cadmium efflux system protein